MARRYLEVYAAIHACIAHDVELGILNESRLKSCTENMYSKALYAIKHGLTTVEETLWAYSLEEDKEVKR